MRERGECRAFSWPTLGGLVLRAIESLCLPRFRLRESPGPYRATCASGSLAA